jgi:PIN domain nuclease of toxin-antitoxin system
MRYLIDTNILIFYLSDLDKLDKYVTSIIENYENTIFVSSESVKEIIHLHQNDRIKLNINDIVDFIENQQGFIIKYVTKQHLNCLEKLPIISKHNDPSDRLIIAQAISEKIPLISSDGKFDHYKKYHLDFIFNEI